MNLKRRIWKALLPGRIAVLAAILTFSATAGLSADLPLPNAQGSLKIAVIGDAGTGGRRQKEISRLLTQAHQRFPFTTVLMLGDNLYGRERPSDYQKKFERPYAELLASGVKFYAVLGNHDLADQRLYPGFNMGGERYYSVEPAPGVRVLALDSTAMTEAQLAWLKQELARPGAEWKIVAMHHPLYSSGKRHGPALALRKLLEPILVDANVNLVFAGHEHFYERYSTQQGIYYFISGAAGKLRKNNIRLTSDTKCGYDVDNSFMLVEIATDAAHFATIARDGRIVDSGSISRTHPDQSTATCGPMAKADAAL